MVCEPAVVTRNRKPSQPTARQIDNRHHFVEARQPEGRAKAARAALEVAREIGDRSGARSLNHLAAVLLELQDLAGARRAYEEGVAAFLALGETRNEAIALSSLGEVLVKQGQPDAAEERFASLRVSRTAEPAPRPSAPTCS